MTVGTQVTVPFGKGDTLRKGTVVGLSAIPSLEPEKLKEISSLLPGAVSVDSQMLALAWWMKDRYGSTMSQALKTVLPVKTKVTVRKERTIVAQTDREEPVSYTHLIGRNEGRFRWKSCALCLQS